MLAFIFISFMWLVYIILIVIYIVYTINKQFKPKVEILVNPFRIIVFYTKGNERVSKVIYLN